MHAQLQIDGPPGAGGGWSFFTPPEVGETATASSPTTAVAGPPPTAAAAATAASKQGALAGWMMISAPSRTEWAENTMRAKVPGEKRERSVLGLVTLVAVFISMLGNGHRLGCLCFHVVNPCYPQSFFVLPEAQRSFSERTVTITSFFSPFAWESPP